MDNKTNLVKYLHLQTPIWGGIHPFSKWSLLASWSS